MPHRPGGRICVIMSGQKRNGKYIAVAAVFFVLCAFFSLGMLLPGAADAADGGEMPRLLTEDGLSSS